MKKLFTKVAAGLMLLAFTQSHAGDNLWKKFDGKTAPSRMPMTTTPKEYEVFTLDQAAMRSFLWGLSTEYAEAGHIILPTPDKKFRSFHIWNVPMMEPGLAERYPEIRTFTAVADDDPNVTAKVDYTLFGFSAMVFDGEKTYMIDPYSNAADGYYIAFYKKDYAPAFLGSCELRTPELAPADGGTPTTIQTGGEGTPAQKVNGSVRRTYRLAMSCTHEYAVAAVGANPTVPQTLSKIATTVNRVNGFYERELSVHMNLIANNDAIIYVNASNDPYTCNLNLACLIGEVQTNITSVIGAPNYDIGHILCTAGGGLAQLSAVCSGGKASGTSTSGGPDDIHVILHEMGHQFGSNHTFSAGTGGCAGNGNAATGYEPGAGISTMSYAGLCDPNNVGQGTDFFHVSSLNEIGSFLTALGNSCGTIATGNTPVSIPALVDSFNIPRNTPFELTAPEATAVLTDTNLLYSWEQWDLGNFEGTEAQNANADQGPLFRSYLPTASRTRGYPEYTNIIGGTYGDGPSGAGQRLAKVARTIRFKLTARSLYQGWGTFQFIDSVVRLKVDATAGNFRVTSQATPETWNPGESKLITWDVGSTTGGDVNCGWVNIYLSTDNGETFPLQLVANAPNTGAYTVTVPGNVNTTSGRIKVKGAGNIFFDINKAAITLTGTPDGIKERQLAENLDIYPNPAKDYIAVTSKNKYGYDLKAVMYNAVGQRVWSGDIDGSTRVPVGGLARGHYLIQVIDGNSGVRTTRKVVLQ